MLGNSLLAFGFAYLLGSIPFGLLLTKAAGLGDVRQIGSGNIGATNVLRTGRKGLAAATLLLDGAKGAVAVLLARHFVPELGDQGARASVQVVSGLVQQDDVGLLHQHPGQGRSSRLAATERGRRPRRINALQTNLRQRGLQSGLQRPISLVEVGLIALSRRDP